MARPPRGTPRGDEQILQALTTLLESTDIVDLAVEEITSHAGLSRKSFYLYFDSKYAALAALGTRFLDEALAVVAPETWDWQNEPFSAWADRGVRGATAVWEAHAVVLRACYQAAPVDPTIHGIVDQLESGFAAGLAASIRAFTAQGHIKPVHDDIETLTRLLARLGSQTLFETVAREGTAWGDPAFHHAFPVIMTALFAPDHPLSGRPA